MTKFVRRLDATNSPVFGQGASAFFYDDDSVPQRLKCRLQLILGEWFLNTDAGVPWWQPEGSDTQAIMGGRPDLQYAEAVIKRAILETDGVASIVTFSMKYDSAVRTLTVTFSVTTVSGATLAPITVSPPRPAAAPPPAGSFSVGAVFSVDFAYQLRTYPNMSSLVTGQALVHADDVEADYWLRINTGNPDNLDTGDGKYITAPDGRQWVRS